MRCLLCDRSVDRFETYGVPPKRGRCPHCGAKGRHRAVALFLARTCREKLIRASEVLEIGPSRAATRLMTQPATIGEARYTAIDVRWLKHHANLRAPHRFLRMDARKMEFKNASFDVILCNSLLSFIKEDRSVLREIHRCLKPGGMAMLNVDRAPGPTRPVSELQAEQPGLYTERYRAENGTQWRYGDDFSDRLRSAGFHPLVLNPLRNETPDFIAHNGLKPDFEMLLGFKAESAMAPFLDSVTA